MDAALTRQIWRRAHGRCEYCRFSQEFDDRPFEIDHIRSQKHGGRTVASNLALSCFPITDSNVPWYGVLSEEDNLLRRPSRLPFAFANCATA
jgi:hypothetical protein